MDNVISFTLDKSSYSIKLMTPKDSALMQKLYEQCIDFALLTYGFPHSSTAAQEEFELVPEGKTKQDKYIFGLFNSCNFLLGMIESIRFYPDEQTWWLGLMMLAPDYRKKGLGTKFYQAFESWVAKEDIKQISLLVLEQNELGLRFWKKLGFQVTRKTSPREFGIKTHQVYVLNRAILCKS